MMANTAKASGLVLDEKPISAVEDEIRRRAYELYEARGGEDGHELEDWLQAKAEISNKAYGTQPQPGISKTAATQPERSPDLRRRSKSPPSY
jgi:hypothetical protein